MRELSRSRPTVDMANPGNRSYDGDQDKDEGGSTGSKGTKEPNCCCPESSQKDTKHFLDPAADEPNFAMDEYCP